MSELIPIDNNTDVIIDTTKVTSGYFSGNLGTLAANNLVTSSKSDTQKNYYYDLQHSSEDQFSVAFGHIRGSGSGAASETKAIYRQFANLLINTEDLALTESRGFHFDGVINTTGSGDVGGGKLTDNTSDYEDSMFFIVAERARMKDRVNKKNWTLALTGSAMNVIGAGALANNATSSQILLTDDSDTVDGVATVAGLRYNVVSGSDGSVYAASSSKYYGYFYPQMGIIALRGGVLSASLPGKELYTTASVQWTAAPIVGTGLGLDLDNDGTPDNAAKLAQSIVLCEQKLRSEEDQTSKSYFCRVFANDMNFSNNPTFTSGSDARLRHTSMIGYPHVFITTVGLYQGAIGPQGSGNPELVAVGKLSGPVQKNYGTETTIKVKLTY